MTRELTLRSIDIPTIRRFGIGFDTLFDELMRLNANTGNYPPHNVIRTGDETVTLEIAVAGFHEGELSITLNNRTLTIAGENQRTDPGNWEYLHRGLSRRNFTLKFPLNEFVEVMDASVDNGVLTIYLERRVPEEKKPKQIAINYNK
jgi:molecular chaperone IbpA